MSRVHADNFDAEKVHEVHDMLQLIFHRNKNQHKHAKWWKWLAMLKRSTSSLVAALDQPEFQDGRMESVRRYKDYIVKQLLPRCYLAFSTVVADSQFSSLGTVLLAVLARLARTLRFERETRATIREQPERPASVESAKTPKEDIGEVVRRDEKPPQRQHVVKKLKEPAFSMSEKTQVPQSKTTRDLDNSQKKKKKRKANAIDDLFDGLL